MTTPPRPTEDPGPPQWTREDLALATERRQYDRIDAARQAGQLDTLLRTGTGTGAYDHSAGASSRVGGTWTHEMAAEYLRTHVPPPGATPGTVAAYTEEA